MAIKARSFSRNLPNKNVVFESDGDSSNNDVEFEDTVDLKFGTVTGSKIGTAASEKLSFYGATPVIQQVVPLTTPSVQDVIDALIVLGLVSQSD